MFPVIATRCVQGVARGGKRLGSLSGAIFQNLNRMTRTGYVLFTRFLLDILLVSSQAIASWVENRSGEGRMVD